MELDSKIPTKKDIIEEIKGFRIYCRRETGIKIGSELIWL
jgi:hypothetical protein